MDQVFSAFALPRPVDACVPLGRGLLNRTFLLTLSDGGHLVLQRVNAYAFHDIPALMENISAVTRHIAARTEDPRACLRLVPARDGRSWFRDEQGEYWRVFRYIEDSLCLERAEYTEDLRQCGRGFGSFLRLLGDFPAETLHETIPAFHDTPERFRQLRAAAASDPLGRAEDAFAELDFALSRERGAAALTAARRSGALPTRATHNDTKLNNILLDRRTRKALCVIDLDTVMPGLAAWDFGDAIRSCAAEPDPDAPAACAFSLRACRAFASGFLSACAALTEAELASLPLGARLMTLECGVRFLTDYIMGDKYFRITYERQNLDRARRQFQLLSDMERKEEQMVSILRKLSGR